MAPASPHTAASAHQPERSRLECAWLQRPFNNKQWHDPASGCKWPAMPALRHISLLTLTSRYQVEHLMYQLPQSRQVASGELLPRPAS